MNYPITTLAAALFVGLATLAAGAAHAEKFPYRNLEVEKGPPLTAPEPGDVTFTPKPGAMVVASPAAGASAAPAQSIVNTSKSNTKDRVVQDDAAAVKTPKGHGGVITGTVVISSAKFVEPVGGGGCTGPGLGGGKPKPGCPTQGQQPAPADKGINEKGIK